MYSMKPYLILLALCVVGSVVSFYRQTAFFPEQRDCSVALEEFDTVRKQRDAALKNFNTVFEERDAALMERDSVRKKLVTAQNERDAALKERDFAKKKRDTPPVLSLLRRICSSHVNNVEKQLVATSPKDSIVIDVGLAHGKECLGVAAAGRICRGFEADPHYASLLQQKVKDDNITNAVILHAAVGHENHKVNFEHDGLNKFGVGGRLGNTARREENEVVSVDMVTLDSQFPSSKKEQIFLLKTDTQGFELGVLQGAHNLLKEQRVRFILLEMSIFLMPGKKADASQVMQILGEAGFFCVEMPWHTPTNAECGDYVSNNNPDKWLTELLAAHQEKNGCFTDVLCELSA